MTELKKILHVEDDVDILEISKMVLEGIGQFELMQCSSGKEALKAAPEFNPDLVLMDAMMPEMSGIETLVELRKLSDFADTPVVFMTAKAQPEEIEEFMATGAIGVITKPFDVMTLSDQIRSIWENNVR